MHFSTNLPELLIYLYLKHYQRRQPSALDLLDLVSVECASLCLSVIDDCKNIDIPLLDLQLAKLRLSHSFSNSQTTAFGGSHISQPQETSENGSLEFGLKVDYFNRFLSGFEPLLEHWVSFQDKFLFS